MSLEYILAIDQGTSGTKTVIFDSNGCIVAKASKELKSIYPHIGFVEQDPLGIYENVLDSLKLCLNKFQENVTHDLELISVCGISNQRETFVLWDKDGTPLTNAIVWQCKRSIEICKNLRKSGMEEDIKKKTGLIIDPYFSGTKLLWLYKNDSNIKNAIDAGIAHFGTIETWLLYKLTNGKSYFTDYTNASRTLFFNINNLLWDRSLLEIFNLKNLKLPEVKPSSFIFGESNFNGIFKHKLKISAAIGDSHAAAFGESCFESGMAKATLGTGCSILLNTGEKRITSRKGMVTTICFSLKDKVYYALEGIIVTCGATMEWLKNQLGLIDDIKKAAQLALSVKDNNGVYFIPAFSGLGAPHWKMDVKAMITGITFGCNKNHIIRAALESIPFQIKDVIQSMEEDSEITLKKLNVDGGITSNTFIMQFLADLLNVNVETITGIEEVSALGAAYLAGLESGIFSGLDHINNLNKNKKKFVPGSENNNIKYYYATWQKSIKEAL